MTKQLDLSSGQEWLAKWIPRLDVRTWSWHGGTVGTLNENFLTHVCAILLHLVVNNMLSLSGLELGQQDA